MYAIFQSGGKQYRASKDQVIRLEKLHNGIGKNVKFDKILMIVDNEETKFGDPFVNGSVIEATVIGHVRGKKLKIIKFRRRKHYRKQQGHRQYFTDVKITGIHVL